MVRQVHIPVMTGQILATLAPRPGAIYVDGTFGAGGMTTALLDAAPCTVWAIDRDPDAIIRARALAENHQGRLMALHGCFGVMDELLRGQGVDAVDGIALDVGVSSMQLDEPSRGFSFLKDGPLDMRMGRTGPSASDFVNSAEEQELAEIIFRYGEERRAKRVARAIVAARIRRPIARTGELADIVRDALPRGRGVDPATRTFQALRIHINDELGELDRGLVAAEALLKPEGHLAVICFHSLEDRKVKSFLRARSSAGAGRSRFLPTTDERRRPPSFRLLHRKVMRPTDEEIKRNRRARSARLRSAIRTAAPPWGITESVA